MYTSFENSVFSFSNSTYQNYTVSRYYHSITRIIHWS